MHLAVTAASAGLLGSAVALAAGDPPPPALPERLLKIELRCAAETPPPALSPRPGDRVVGTTRPASGVTVSTAPRAAADGGPAPMEVTVANGRGAALRWSGPQVAWDLVLDTAYAPAPASRAARPALPEPFVAMRLLRRVQSLQVQPRWSGGERPVRVELNWSAGDAGAGAPALRTVVDAPLGRWMPLARVQSPEASPVGHGCALELRVRPAP